MVLENLIELNIKKNNIVIPDPSVPSANYIPFRRAGNILFLSGVPPRRSDNTIITGRIGDGMTLEDGYCAARYCGLTLLSNIRSAVGSLDKVDAFLKVTGYIRATDGFNSFSKIMDGCTDLFLDVFGESGRTARTALGVAGLPRGIPVEVEAIVLIKDC